MDADGPALDDDGLVDDDDDASSDVPAVPTQASRLSRRWSITTPLLLVCPTINHLVLPEIWCTLEEFWWYLNTTKIAGKTTRNLCVAIRTLVLRMPHMTSL